MGASYCWQPHVIIESLCDSPTSQLHPAARSVIPVLHILAASYVASLFVHSGVGGHVKPPAKLLIEHCIKGTTRTDRDNETSGADHCPSWAVRCACACTGTPGAEQTAGAQLSPAPPHSQANSTHVQAKAIHVDQFPCSPAIRALAHHTDGTCTT